VRLAARSILVDAFLGLMAITLKVVLVSGVVLLEDYEVDSMQTVRDVKRLIHDAKGEVVARQQLVINGSILPDRAHLSELGLTGELTIMLIRRSTAHYSWMPAFRLNMAHGESIDWCGICAASDGGHSSGLTLHYYPAGSSSVMVRPGYCTIEIQRPENTVLWCRVEMNGVARERCFLGSFATIAGWANFCEIIAEPVEIMVSVMHFGLLPSPVVTSQDELVWDLRAGLGGMPIKEGQQLPGAMVQLGDVELQLIFCPRSTQTSSALRVIPISGLGARRYSCTVDGTTCVGDGESTLNFPLVEDFGHIGLQLLPLRTHAPLDGVLRDAAIDEVGRRIQRVFPDSDSRA